MKAQLTPFHSQIWCEGEDAINPDDVKQGNLGNCCEKPRTRVAAPPRD